jgi:hypothetical protein
LARRHGSDYATRVGDEHTLSHPMRILFFFRHNGFVRNFEWMLRLLAERGHSVELAFQFARGEGEIPERLEAEYENVRIGRAPARNDLWLYVAYRLRYAIDYLRYLRPEYEHAPKLRARGRKKAPRLVVWLTRVPPFRSSRGRARLDSLLRALERALPAPSSVERFVAERRPAVVLATPYVDGPWQEDYVAAAQRLGIPTGLPVASWDNLTNKGVIRHAPERIYVWNEIQRREAVELHGVDPNRVTVVGGHSYDHWFEWQPSTTREEFCARLGIRPDRPILLYLCSSGFVAENIESEIVSEWLEAVRSHDDPVLREASVVVRPHFRARATWEGDPLAGVDNAAVWPPEGADPRTPEARADYFDSLHHSAATVGANTTALIEAAILGRRSFTFLHPRLKETQGGTLHFHYLKRENGGPLEAAASIEEHLGALVEVLRRPSEPDWNREFVELFVRPHGLDVACAPVLASEVEQLAALRPEPEPEATASSRVLRGVLLPVALLTNLGRPTRLWQNLYPRDVLARDQGAGHPRRRRTLKGAVRRAFYRTAHTLLPASVRLPLRSLVRGRSADEHAAARQAARLAAKEARAHEKEELNAQPRRKTRKGGRTRAGAARH